MPRKRETSSDFRYDTGEARVPWAAVGESVRHEDIMAMIEGLVRPLEGGKGRYEAQLAKVAKELEKLAAVGQYAGKLSLGDSVKALEEAACKLLKAKHAVFLTNATAGFEMGFRFAGLRMAGANLSETNLADARFMGVDMGGVNLSHARMSRAKMMGTNLQDADLTEADHERTPPPDRHRRFESADVSTKQNPHKTCNLEGQQPTSWRDSNERGSELRPLLATRDTCGLALVPG